MTSAEERFYKKYNKYDLDMLNIQSNQVPEGFQLGGRYNICINSIDKNCLMNRKLIVELGCASGERLLYLKKKFNFKASMGCDLAFNEEYQIDNSFFFSENLNEEWRFSDGSVDCLLAMMIFEHLFDPWFCFSELKRVLAPNGRAFVNLPLVTGVKNRLRLLFGNLPETSVSYSKWKQEGHWDGFHLHYFSIPTIIDLAENSGLRLIRKSGVGRFRTLKNFYPSLLCSEISFELAHA